MAEEAEFTIILNSKGEYYYNTDGEILIQRTIDGTQFYVSPECIEEIGLTNQSQDLNQKIEINEDIDQINNNHDLTDCKETQRYWTKEEILLLINLYKINKPSFASSTVKNIKVWQNIAKQLGSNHSAKQCENKFKYLKSTYLKKKDNMSQNSSGARNIHFEYFDDMDDIFRKEPIVQPLAIASSSRENCMTVDSDEASRSVSVNEEPNNSEIRSRRTIKLKEALNELNAILKESEAEKKNRHEQLLQLQKENMDRFSELMGKILDKM